MHKNVFTLLLIFLFGAMGVANAAQMSIFSACEQISTKLIEGYVKKGAKLRKEKKEFLSLAIGIVFEKHSEKRTPLSSEIEGNLEIKLWEGENFITIERAQLKQLLSEIKLQMSDLVDRKTAKRLNKLKGVDALMIGDYTVEPTALTLRCRIVDVETGWQLSNAVKRIPFDKLPPARIETLKVEAKTPLPQALQNEPKVNSFELDFWYETMSKSGEPIRRKLGESVECGRQVNIVAKTNRDAYVYAFTVDADYEIFPFWNTPAGDAIFFKPGETKRTEGTINEPLGTARFYAIAHTEPFNYSDIKKIVEKEIAYLRSKRHRMDWRPIKARNLPLLDETKKKPVRFVQANLWFEQVKTIR